MGSAGSGTGSQNFASAQSADALTDTLAGGTSAASASCIRERRCKGNSECRCWALRECFCTAQPIPSPTCVGEANVPRPWAALKRTPLSQAEGPGVSVTPTPASSFDTWRGAEERAWP